VTAEGDVNVYWYDRRNTTDGQNYEVCGDVLLGNQFVKQADVNLFGTGSVLYSYDLGTQNRDMFEVGGTAFANHYFQVGRLDLALEVGEIRPVRTDARRVLD
jgi:hypothetical protein